MLRAIFVFSLLCLSAPFYVYAKDEFQPPLSALVQQEDKGFIDSQDYLFRLDEKLKQSIRTPRQMWDEHNNRSLENRTYEYLAQFKDWYLTELPRLIVVKKSSKGQSDSVLDIPEEAVEKAFFLFRYVPFNAQAMIDLASYYNYSRAEKLNLFLTAFNKNISEKELLKVMEAWNILDHITVYVQEYESYLDKFFNRIPEGTRTIIDEGMRQLQRPITTVLHQVVKWGKITLFNQMMKKPKWDVNVRNYLLQTGLHESSDREWSRGGPYIIALLEHPEIDINARNVYGRSPIFPAIRNSEPNSFAMVQKYLEYKSKLDLSVVDNRNRGLVLTAAESDLPELAKYLHEEGAPFPKEVSLLNSYLTNAYRVVVFRYDFTVNVTANLQVLFSYQRNKPHFQVFDHYLSTEEASELLYNEEKSWENFRYYFLFRELRSLVNNEEELRYSFTMSSIYRDSTVEYTVNDQNIPRIVAAIYNEDISTLKKFFSKKQNRKKYLNNALFQYVHLVKDPWSKRVFEKFLRLDPVSTKVLEKTEAVSFEVGTFLGEAIRANSVEAVSLLLGLGADPTIDINSVTLRNAVMAVILNGRVLHKYLDRYDQYLVILEKVMSHSSVTKDFLSQEVFPGINYADFAALEGNLNALKWVYKKGASISKKTLWDSKLTMEMLSFQRDFIRQTIFLLEEKLKENDTEDRSTRDFLSMCRGAFH